MARKLSLRSTSLLLIFTMFALTILAILGSFSRPQNASAQTYRNVGYLTSWSGSVNTAQIDLMTHINYAFLIPTTSGGLNPIENPSKLQQLVSAAHARGKKVLISVGGWNNGDDSGFESIAANATYRTNFATNLFNFMNQYALDGIDIDWEYPEAGDQYYAMMSAIRNRIGSGKLLTAAVSGSSSGGAGVGGDAIGIMDYITIMAYDGDGGAGHSPYSYAQSAMDYWGSKTTQKNKLVLGVPFYSRPGWYGYNVLRAGGCSADSDTCSYGGATQYYNGRPTMNAKVDLMKNRGGGGMMHWELSQDTAPGNSDSLLRTIYNRLYGGTAPATATRTRTPCSTCATATRTRTPTAGGTVPTRTPTRPPTSGTWAPNTWYAVGAVVTYNGVSYRCQQAHTSQVGWEPPNVPALWVRL